MGDAYVASVREARSRSVVLKAQVISIRSSKPKVPIIVFEGITDVGAYDVWISKHSSTLNYLPLSANGKGQSIEFYSSVVDGKEPWQKLIYFIVDSDFDGLRGCKHSEKIFQTCSYSMENYLISPDALRSLLYDEFENASDIETNEKIIAHYEKVLNDVCLALTEANKRIYFAQNNKLGSGSKEEKIKKYLDISLSGVRCAHNADDLVELVPLTREPTEDEYNEINEYFSKIRSMTSQYRGKYLYSFFMDWIFLLAEDRKTGEVFFSNKKNIKYGRGELTHRSLASRVRGPDKLGLFINKISSDFSVAGR